ncbi:MAG TPA: YraN family protein [Paenalcaligenes sp.]|nr:YraN family protein [Paenalcaligenes sp.]
MAKKTSLRNKQTLTTPQPTPGQHAEALNHITQTSAPDSWQRSHQRARHAQRKLLQKTRKTDSTRPTTAPVATTAINTPSSKGSPTQRLGQHFEQQAAQFLRQQGYQILAQQLRYPYGEIDLVAWSDPYLVLVEVRHRARTDYGGALGSISTQKKQRLRRAALHTYQEYQKAMRRRDLLLRLDVIAFEGQQLHWLPNAITYE